MVFILETISKRRSEERQKLNLSGHFLHSKLLLSCDAQMSFAIKEEKLFSITKNGFPCLPVPGQLHPTEVLRMEPQAGRQMSLCPLICAYFSQRFLSKGKKKKNRSRGRLQPDWDQLHKVSKKSRLLLGEKKKTNDCPWNRFYDCKFQSISYQARFKKKKEINSSSAKTCGNKHSELLPSFDSEWMLFGFITSH